jgi:hypothetical protein
MSLGHMPKGLCFANPPQAIIMTVVSCPNGHGRMVYLYFQNLNRWPTYLSEVHILVMACVFTSPGIIHHEGPRCEALFCLRV